jgi:hypothetical protein
MIYVKIGDAVAKYEGMSLETVQDLLSAQNISFVVLNEENYTNYIKDLENKK